MISTAACGREECKVPILGNIPIEGIGGVDQGAEIQQPGQADFTESVELERIIVPQFGSQDNDWKGRSVFQGVGQMLTALVLPFQTRSADSHVFNQTLSEPNDARRRDNKGHDVVFSTPPVRFRCASGVRPEEHAECHDQVTEDLGIAGQSICKKYVPEFPVLGLRQTADTNPSKGHKESVASRA